MNFAARLKICSEVQAKKLPRQNVGVFLSGFECEVSNFGRTTDTEWKPRTISDVNIAKTVTDFHDAASIFKNREEWHAENSELTSVSVSRQSQCKISFCSVVDKFGVVRE